MKHPYPPIIPHFAAKVNTTPEKQGKTNAKANTTPEKQGKTSAKVNTNPEKQEKIQ